MRKLIFFALLAFAISCTPPVVFEQAYPSGEEDLESIPDSYLGAFICESDSALVVISDYNITIHKSHFFDSPVAYIEERADCKIVEDKMYVSGREECIPIELLNDSIVRGTVIDIDTLFFMQPGSNVRLYKGHLVVNQEISKGKWAVSLLSPEDNGDVYFRAITSKTKIKNIEKVTPTEKLITDKDRDPKYRVNPTMKEFDALLADEKVFIECEYLIRYLPEN